MESSFLPFSRDVPFYLFGERVHFHPIGVFLPFVAPFYPLWRPFDPFWRLLALPFGFTFGFGFWAFGVWPFGLPFLVEIRQKKSRNLCRVKTGQTAFFSANESFLKFFCPCFVSVNVFVFLFLVLCVSFFSLSFSLISFFSLLIFSFFHFGFHFQFHCHFHSLFLFFSGKIPFVCSWCGIYTQPLGSGHTPVMLTATPRERTRQKVLNPAP